MGIKKNIKYNDNKYSDIIFLSLLFYVYARIPFLQIALFLPLYETTS